MRVAREEKGEQCRDRNRGESELPPQVLASPPLTQVALAPWPTSQDRQKKRVEKQVQGGKRPSSCGFLCASPFGSSGIVFKIIQC